MLQGWTLKSNNHKKISEKKTTFQILSREGKIKQEHDKKQLTTKNSTVEAKMRCKTGLAIRKSNHVTTES